MTRWLTLLLACLLMGFENTPLPATNPSDARFTSVQVFIDPHDQKLAAYQLEFVADPQRVTLVGIEGGEHAAYQNPPYYDPAALSHNRVILAAFSTAGDVPSAKTRVATLHLRVTGANEPAYSTKLQAAADSEGKTINAEVSISAKE